jgi:hypothetical protein
MARRLYSRIAAMFSSLQRQFQRLLTIAAWNLRRHAAAGTPCWDGTSTRRAALPRVAGTRCCKSPRRRNALPFPLPVASH